MQVWIGWMGPDVIGEMVPSESQTKIRLVPPIEIHSEVDLTRFLDWVETYCSIAFAMSCEPQVIDASNWRDGLPAGI